MRRPTNETTRRLSLVPDANGFSLVEVIIAITIFVVIVGIALLFLRDAHRNLETESGALETQQAARVAVDEVARNVQQAGYGIKRGDPYNSAGWQRAVVHAGAHALSFNADIDPARGPMSGATTLTFPDGSTYRGEGVAGNAIGAETYIYTIDANDDATISAADRTAAASGSTNPASETANPLDYALFRRIYGYDGSGYGGSLVPVVATLFTNGTSTDLYGDGTSPNPLFSYTLTEDLNSDASLDSSECVVTPCPPSSARTPQLYLWGDTDFSGRLSDAEKGALRTLPVGSASWSKNRLASGGSYYSTTLTTAIPIAGTVAKVTDAANFGKGEHIIIGSGGTAEALVVDSVDTTKTPDEITLTSAPAYTHGAGETVVIHPQTLLRAIRNVQIAFDAITPKKDHDSALASAAVGRAGRAGTKGLDYRVRNLERRVEIVNLQTGALKTTYIEPTCPATFTGTCSGSAQATLDVFTPRSTPATISFILRDSDGVAMSGKTVNFGTANPSVGSVLPANAITDSNGIATTNYIPAGIAGTDTVTASHACTNTSLVNVNASATLAIKVYKLEVAQTGYDCLGTYRVGYSAPTSGFTVKVQHPDGSYVPNFPVTLTLGFDPGFVPVFTKIEGQLAVNASVVGTTTTAGSFGPYSTDTDSGGTRPGSFGINKDTDGTGSKLLMTATVADTSCARAGTSVTLGARFYKLTVASVDPSTSCTESAPCTIPTNTIPYPSVKASLSILSVPSASVPITFTSDNFLKPSGSAATVFNPASGWTTDVNGDATVQVYNNNDSAITVGTPLKTHVDATSAGDPLACLNGNVTSTMALRPQFDYTGPTASGCDIDIQQAYVKKGGGNDKLCIDVKNVDPVGGCSVAITGVRLAVYKSGDNVNIDTTKFKLQKLHGGDDNASYGTCSTANGVQLFIKDCNRFCAGGVNAGLSCTANGDCPGSSCPGGADLTNNTQWSFMNYTTKCYVPASPPNPTEPQNFFVMDNAEFSDNLAGLSPKRRFVITVTYTCGGICLAGSPQTESFDLLSP